MSDRGILPLLLAALIANYKEEEKEASIADTARRMALQLRVKPEGVKHPPVDVSTLAGTELKRRVTEHLGKHLPEPSRFTKQMSDEDCATFLVEAVCQHFYKGKKPHCTYRKTRRLKLLSREAYNKCKVIARKSASGYESDQSIHD